MLYLGYGFSTPLVFHSKGENGVERLRTRWFYFPGGLLLLAFAYPRGEVKEAVLAFILGAAGGFALDYIGVAKLHLWQYPRQPFGSFKYFAITVSCWGIFNMAVNLFWDRTGAFWLAFLVVTIVFLIVHEFPNTKMQSWTYSVPLWVVGVGWIPLILVFRGVFVLLQRTLPLPRL